MTLDKIKRTVSSTEYDFLRTNPHLGNNIILLGLGGSHAYGTNTETSDLDVRGIALNSKSEILTHRNPFEQFVNEETDTVIYGFNKMIGLLTDNNPNTIEILGLDDSQYLYLSPIGKELVDNAHIFLSKKSVKTFGGYANQQLYRLNQLCKHQMAQDELEAHILKTMNFTMDSFAEHYADFSGGLNLYVDKSHREELVSEIFCDINLSHYPLRDLNSLMNDFTNIIRSYNKVGQRNSKAKEHGKIGKHMMHLVRLYFMVFDILEKHEIVTHREKEHDFLMEIRFGKYIDENNQVKPEFFDIVKKLEAHLVKLAASSTLPERPNYEIIDKFQMSVNERVINGLI